ncbi:MAG TPA: guanylate kinase [Bacteroidales bacterium]|nr:guanylate kinase [Bacteroidales bacterium]
MVGKLVIICGPSGTGKTSIVKYLLDSSLNLEFSISATTRNPRGDEKNGSDYFFLSVEEFRKKISKGEFVEWEEVYPDIFYGTLKSEMEKIWSSGCHVLFDVDVKGGLNLKKLFGNRAIALFIMPPSIEDLKKRLESRATDSKEKIAIRVGKAEQEMKLANHFDTIIVNKTLDLAREEAKQIVSSFLEL